MIIRAARREDVPWLCEHDRHIAPPVMEHAVSDGRVLLAERDGQPVGWLRYGLFWDEIPFVNLLFVLEECRGQGLGTALMQRWEQEMRAAGHARVLTSTQADETSQHFYRRLGYADVGGFRLDGESYELILLKTF